MSHDQALAAFTADVQRIDDAAHRLDARVLVLTSQLRDGDVVGTPHAILVGTLRPHQLEAVDIVRRGLRDILDWLGEDPNAPRSYGEQMLDRVLPLVPLYGVAR